MPETSISPKEFLTQAEQKYGKKAGWIIKAVIFGGGAVALALALPAIIAFLGMLAQAIGLAIVCGILVVIAIGLYMFASDPRVKAMWRDQMDGFIVSLRKKAIEINPIDRLQAYADEYLEGKKGLVEGVKDFIRGLQNKHTGLVEQQNAELQRLVAEANARQRRSCIDAKANMWKDTPQGVEDRDEFRLASNNIRLLKDSLARLEKMTKRYELFMTLLDKYGRAFDISIRQTRSIIQMTTNEYVASQGMVQAQQAMSGVMEQTDERTKLANATLDFVTQEIANNVAQIENFFDRTKSIIASADLQSDMAEESLLAELSEMGHKTDQAISTLEQTNPMSIKDMMSRVKGADSVSVETRATASMPSGDSQYADLLKKVRKN